MSAFSPVRKPVILQTERFDLRSLRPDDATLRHRRWYADPEVVHPLNRPVTELSRDDLVGIIRTCNDIDRFQVGIFVREDGQHIGNHLISLDPPNGTASFHVMIGDRSYWGDRVVLETRAALLDHFFLERGVEKAVGGPLARNVAAVFNYKAQGWRLEGLLKGQVRSNLNEERLDQYQFGLLKEEWMAKREETRDDAGA